MSDDDGGHLEGAATREPHDSDGDTDPRLIAQILLRNYIRK